MASDFLGNNRPFLQAKPGRRDHSTFYQRVDHLTQHMGASERSMQDRIQKLEAIRIALEEELSQTKAAALTERGQAEEELIKVRNQARLEEQQRLEHLEEKLRLMTESRDEAQNCCLKQKQMVAEAQAKASQLSLHADGLRRRLEELQQVIWTGVEMSSPQGHSTLPKLFGY